MAHGIRRQAFQVLPASGERITCVQYGDNNQATKEWWERSLIPWKRMHLAIPAHGANFREWKFVLIAPLKTVQECWSANDGMMAWMDISGYVVPDLCRQEGGCPEVWHVDSVRKKRELRIANLAEIEEYVVMPDHKQVTKGPFPEMLLHVSAQ